MYKRFYFFFMFLLGMLMLVDSSAFAQNTYVENFDDPLGGWTSRWLYQNTNLENYYVAGGTCDPNNRGNEPNGLWISDNRGCSTLVAVNPVRINLLNNFGDTATSFALDVGVCASNTTLRIYDRNGALVVTDSLPPSCFNLVNHTYALTNGISAFEFNADGQVEGNTSIDDVTIIIGAPRPTSVPTMTEWGMIIFIALAGLGSVYYLRRQGRA